MAIGFSNSASSGYFDSYGGQRYHEEQERRYRKELERQQMMALQNTIYNPNTDMYRGVSAQQMEEAKPTKKVCKAEPDYVTNKNLLLLGATS